MFVTYLAAGHAHHCAIVDQGASPPYLLAHQFPEMAIQADQTQPVGQVEVLQNLSAYVLDAKCVGG